MIDLYTAATPNGIKIPIALEELGVPYVVHRMDMGSAAFRDPAFLAINPNGKIPAIRHRDMPAGGEVTLFESAAILIHLAETFGGLMGTNPQARAQTLSWLILQVAGLGPAMGNTAHFRVRESVDPYPLARFQGEALRLLRLLEDRLSHETWLNGESYSIADIAHFGWVRSVGYAGFGLEDFPALASWVERIEARPATVRALAKLA